MRKEGAAAETAAKMRINEGGFQTTVLENSAKRGESCQKRRQFLKGKTLQLLKSKTTAVER